MKKIILSLLTLMLTGGYLSAEGDISSIFKAGLVDMNTLGNGYLKPAGNSFSAGLGSNWYNSAKVHKTWGFDLTVGAGVVLVPLSDQNFDVTHMMNVRPTNSVVTQAPTFAGKKDGGIGLDIMQPHYLSNGNVNPFWQNGTGKITSFNSPGGVSKYIPTASVQFTLGLPYINDVSVRFIPTVNVKGVGASLWGVGIKHNIKQWIPVVKDLPFDAAVVLAYSKFSLNYAFADNSITPDKLVGNDGTTFSPDPNSSDYSKQAIKLIATAKTANIVFSKKLAFITPYIGFGITSTTFDVSETGNFPTLGDPKTINAGGVEVPVLNSNGKPIMQIKNYIDPLKISSNEVMPNTTIGLRFKFLWILSVHAQYAIQKYPLASVGVGLTFR